MRNKKMLLITISLIITIVLSIFLVKPEEGQADNKFNMTYLYFGDTNNQMSLVDKTNGSLSVISPNYFNIDNDGSLLLTSLLSTEFVRNMHAQNIKVVPFISNHWDRALGRAALQNREALADEIVAAVKKYNLDGINVDIENVTEVDRTNYTDFVRILRSKLPEGKELSVAVAANPRGFTTGWHGSYDYEALAKYSDYLMLMAYDESYYGSKPGPVASRAFVENSIKYALNRVSPEKIVLGIPFFGRYWNNSETVGGNGISLVKAESIIKHYNGKVYFDKSTMSPYATFTVSENDTKLIVNGKAITPGKHTVWFENEDSIKNKLQLVHKYNLKGTGSWSLGQELPSTWDYYKLWLNNKYFADIESNWAKNDILSIVAMGWMKGTSNVKFSPAVTLTRAQAATTLVRALGLDETSITNGQKFSDVPLTHWANNEIQISTKKGIFEGVGNGKFAPNDPVTREQMATLLSRITDYEDVKDYKNPFNDVKPSWSYDSIMQMNRAGIFVGFEDKTFRPKAKISRAELATVLNRVKDSIDFH